MTLYDMLPKDGSETGITDRDYDMESYFYFTEDGDEWDMAMMDLAKILTADHVAPSGNIVVNLSEVIEDHLKALRASDLFISKEVDLDEIMDGIETILAGNVSEDWMVKFVDILGGK